MKQHAYLQINPPKAGMPYGNFSLFVPALTHYVEYRFEYERDPIDPELGYNEGPNNPANRSFYRIRTAWVVQKAEQGFTPLFRALQQGEIGLAFREEGAGDYVGGFHGDENLTDVSLFLGDRQLPLDKPYFGIADGFRFAESSRICRCNTPELILANHDQLYTLDGNTLRLSQTVRWVTDTMPIQEACMPMLTAQRLDPEDTGRILTDTVELYAPDGTLAASFDTTPYTTADDMGPQAERYIYVYNNTYATSAKVYGKNSGFCVEGGYTILENSIPREQISTNLCMRLMPSALDNKIYFRIWSGEGPKAGTAWKTDVYYRITFHK